MLGPASVSLTLSPHLSWQYLNPESSSMINESLKTSLRRVAFFLLAVNLAPCSKLAHSQSIEAQFDGPAELPRMQVKSSLADSPVSGKVRSVSADGNFQEALDKASCGDTIKLQAGATYRGAWKLPAKQCDDAHWIIIRTSAPDSSLPPEGTRITPCYAGVASLPG